MTRLTELVGYRVVGRKGEIGRVVETEAVDGEPESLVVRGGMSDALVYHVPEAKLLDISPELRIVRVDVDIGDFLARLGDGGVIELRLL